MKTIALLAALIVAMTGSIALAQHDHDHGAAPTAAAPTEAAPAPTERTDARRSDRRRDDRSMSMGDNARGAAAKNDTGPSSAAFAAINAKMHESMAIPLTGDADVDFVRGMIPHHQGAIDMAKVVLGFGKDPQIHKLAEDVIKAQEGEIALMKDWLAKQGK
jgi:uncharacterized protein (DUF305 family)